MTDRQLEKDPQVHATGPAPGAVPVVADHRTTGQPPWDPAEAPQPTAPVPGPPPRRGASVQPRVPRVRMGPWAPVAGGALGLAVGLVVTLVALAPLTLTFGERLASVFLCLGLALLGTGGVLLADEVRLRRHASTRSVETVAGLLNGLTPARFLVGAAGFVLLLAAYVTRG